MLVAETFRQEHRSALQWLNSNSRDSVSFFGIALKVWRIGGSIPAPQLDVLVEPDEWVRSVHAATPGELSDTQLAYRDWWAEFLPAFHERYPRWSRAKAPSKDNWMNFPSGKSGFHYSVNFCRRDGRPAFRFELYVDGKDENVVDRRFTQLMERRAATEDAFEDALDWERLYGKFRTTKGACAPPGQVGAKLHALGWGGVVRHGSCPCRGRTDAEPSSSGFNVCARP